MRSAATLCGRQGADQDRSGTFPECDWLDIANLKIVLEEDPSYWRRAERSVNNFGREDKQIQKLSDAARNKMDMAQSSMASWLNAASLSEVLQSALDDDNSAITERTMAKFDLFFNKTDHNEKLQLSLDAEISSLQVPVSVKTIQSLLKDVGELGELQKCAIATPSLDARQNCNHQSDDAACNDCFSESSGISDFAGLI